MARRACLVLLAALLAALAPAAAQADGDPASDYLLSQRVFLPFDAKVPGASARELKALVQEARKQGYPVEVALIADSYDLGSVVSLWRQPHQYARFLGTEIAFVFKGPLLVVMPNGYGVSQSGHSLAAMQRRLEKLPTPAVEKTDVGTAAIRAVEELAAAAGHPLATPVVHAPTGENRTADRLKLVAGAALLTAIAGAAVLGLRLRRRRRGPHAPAAGSDW